MTQPLAGRVAIVTGAGSTHGIGRSIALGLVGAGAKVAYVDVEQASVDRNVAEAVALGGAACAMGITADVTDFGAVSQAVKRTLAELGGLHIVVNNAGVGPSALALAQGGKAGAKTWEVSPEIFARVVAINLNGAFHFIHATADHLLKQGWGRIIGVTSSLDTMLAPREVPYGPSKAAHEAMISALAGELEGSGVTVNAVTPGGMTYTDQLAVMMKAAGRAIAPADMIQSDVMAGPCVWLSSAEADGFTNQRILANRWDDSLPLAARLAKACAPSAWQQLGAQAVAPRSAK